MAIGTLPYQELKKLIANGNIHAAIEIGETQIQPASLDLRLGATAWSQSVFQVPGKLRAVKDLFGGMVPEYDLSKNDGITVSPGLVYTVLLAEHVSLPYNICATGNAKSTAGRLGLLTRLVVDGSESYDKVPAGYSGPLYVQIVSKSFDVRLRRGDCINQIRLHRGSRWQERKHTLHIDLELEPCVYQARYGTVDYRNLNHETKLYWRKMKAIGGEIILLPGYIYIMRSIERVSLKGTEAAEVSPISPEFGDFRVHYAGFVDPGFVGHVVLELWPYDTPILLRHGQPIGMMVTEYMTEVPETLYGQNGKNHYQDQGLKLARQFC